MKIINVIHFPFTYHMPEDVKPAVKWEIGNGNWCGIWKGNWSQRVGDAILNAGYKIEYEVWRPDLRADKIYSLSFENGLIYKLFPAFSAKRFDSLKMREQLRSPALMESLKEITENEHVIIHLNSSPLIYINYKIINNFSNGPIVMTLHGNQKICGSKFPIYNYVKQQNIRAKWKNVNDRIDYITYQNHEQKQMLENIGFNKPKGLVTMGCDFDSWIPSDNVPSCEKLKFLMASRFVPLKQIDKIIQIFLDLSDKYDFLLTIAGTGQSEYTEYLKELASTLTKRKKIKFAGYLLDNKLIEEYQKHDYFIMASTSEGCPVSVMEALACKLKVFTTGTGFTAELFEKYNAGVVVPPYDYNQWKLKLIKILNGEHANVLDREIAKQWFHWPNIARKFMNIYRKLADFH